MFIIGAEDPESGKTLLAEVLHCACFGKIPMPSKLALGEGLMERRNLSATIRDTGTDVIWFDEPRRSNTQTEIVSDTLNLIATAAAGMYRDRPVYQRQTIELDVLRTFILTGNNAVKLLGTKATEAQALLEELIFHGGKDAKTWEHLYDLVGTTADQNIALSKVMGLFNVASWRTKDHRQVHFKRLAAGRGGGVRYRLTTSGSAKLDKRGGNANVAAGRRRTT
jgi:hypothetical protein